MPDIFVASPNLKKKKPQAEISGKKRINKPDLVKKNVSFLTSYRLKPDGVSFKDQDKDEEIFIFLRAHFITNIPWIAFGIILILVPPLLFFLFRNNPFPISLSPSYALVLIIFYYLAIFSYLLIGFITWFFNISLVTDERVVDVDFSDVVYHDIALTKLDLIEDINFIQSGFIRSLFDYGDVFIQTAGEKVHFDFLSIPHPEETSNIIENLIGGDKNVV